MLKKEYPFGAIFSSTGGDALINSEAKQPKEALIKRVLCCDCTWQWRVFCNAVSDAESTKQASTGCAGACTRMQRGSITAGATAASLGRQAK